MIITHFVLVQNHFSSPFVAPVTLHLHFNKIANLKADYYDHVLDAPDTYSTTTIAKSCGLTARELNRFLHEQKVQYRLHDGWVLYARYDGKGYTRTVTVIRKYNNGTEKVRIVTKWTQKGREFIIKLLEKAYAMEGSED